MARTMQTGRRKPGPVPKGDRASLTIRVPRDHQSVYREAAAAEGFGSLNDYIAAQLARLHELDVPEYVNRGRTQQQQEVLPVAS